MSLTFNSPEDRARYDEMVAALQKFPPSPEYICFNLALTLIANLLDQTPNMPMAIAGEIARRTLNFGTDVEIHRRAIQAAETLAQAAALANAEVAGNG